MQLSKCCQSLSHLTLNWRTVPKIAEKTPDPLKFPMVRAFRSIGTALLLPPATPKDRVDIFKEAVRKTHTNPDFINEYRKLTSGDEPTPLIPMSKRK